jgi:hypothetical protein
MFSFPRKFASTRPSGASRCAFLGGRLVVAEIEGASVTRFLLSGNGRRFESGQNAWMKTQIMKTINRVMLMGAGLFVSLNLLHAQDAASPFQLDSATVAGMSDLEVELKAIESVPPMPADSVPESGTFWSAQHAPGTADEWPPLPTSLGMGAWSLGDDGVYLLADLNHVYGHPKKSRKAASLAATATASTAGAMTMSAMVDMNPGDGGDDTNSDGGYSPPAFTGTPVDTNTLWLQIFCVTNGTVSLSLNNATDQVYEVMSRTNLISPGWQLETELFPANGTVQTNALPFTVPEGSRTSTLFLRAMDWTGITSNGNTTPDWWFYNFHGATALSGTTALSDTNLDSQGNTLLYDYQNGLDPNVISFSLAVTNLYINSMTAPVQLNISAGTPSYYAVSVDDMNYAADASWQPYAGSNIAVYLGLTEGWHDVWIGLKGLPSNATQTWQYKRLKYDVTPPQLVVTGPATGTVDEPVIQLTGYSPEQLGGISYDLSNAVAVVTNHQVLITGQTYSTNTWEFTTNWFQCFDVGITNGVNTFTLHATDLAGNVTTANFSCTLDCSGKTNPPVVEVDWPQNGDYLSGTNFNVTGQLADPTATVSVQVVDTNGDTNVVSGAVGRDGKFWVQNLPLNSGTNIATVTVQDVFGNTATTNLTLIQSPVVLTINPVVAGQVTVTGTISTGGYTVWVNGVQATNTDGTDWTVQIPPITIGGGAVNAVAVPNGGGQ